MRSFLILLCCATAAFAQTARAELVGEVRDQNGALISAVKVTLTEVATGQLVSREAKDGNYTITNLKPAVYNIAVEATGFKQSIREGVRLATGERVRLDFVLGPGSITDMVTVVGN
ncbi:MAG TPA: carboxypeptidase-like regulatory domain-containing protein, partial [Pyrinomonadaceae bacterium]